MDDILREVVVISDDSDDSDDGLEDSSDDDSTQEATEIDSVGMIPEATQDAFRRQSQQPGKQARSKANLPPNRISKQFRNGLGHQRKQQGSKKNRRGFKRYEAIQQRWEEAVNRNRHAQDSGTASYAPMDRVPSQSAPNGPSVEIVSPVHRADPTWDNRAQPTPQLFYGEGQPRGPRYRPEETPAARYQTEERRDPLPNRPHSGFASSEGVVIGRRIARLPAESRNAAVPERLYHGELKDFLVPSIEPISPHSRPDAQQSIRGMVREEPMRLEQVPTGQAGIPGRQLVHSDIRPMASEYHHRPVGNEFRPAVTSALRERLVPRHEFLYERDLRPNSTIGAPPEMSRVYRVREPVEAADDAQGFPMVAPTRVLRPRGEARPIETWDPKPARLRELSPRRLESYSRAAPSATYGITEHRRVYREASAPGVDAHHSGPGTGSARPLYYEIRPSAQTGYWQGSTFVRPEQSSAAHSQGPERPREVVVRHSAQDFVPGHHAPLEHTQRGRVEAVLAPMLDFSLTVAQIHPPRENTVGSNGGLRRVWQCPVLVRAANAVARYHSSPLAGTVRHAQR